jgi:secretion/DNA translocation related TadE-like protein
MAVIWLTAMTTMVAGGVRAARHRAHAAADGAALAAASRAAEGVAVACRIAATVATGTGARLTACTLEAGPGQTGTGGTGTGRTGTGRTGEDGTGGRRIVPDGGQIADVSVIVIYRGPGWLGAVRIPARARAAPVMPGS